MKPRTIGFILFLAFILIGSLVLPATAYADAPHVLFLNSYSKGYSWSDLITEGIEDELATSAPEIQFNVEYMDSKTFEDEDYHSHLNDLYEYKYLRYHLSPDVIITSDDTAYKFMLAYGDSLFLGVPVVFTGVNHYEGGSLPEVRRGYTGVFESHPIKDTIDVARNINPNLKRLYIVTDGTVTGRAVRNHFEQYEDAYEDFQFEYAHQGMDRTALQNSLESLPENSAVIYVTYYLIELSGNSYNVDSIADELTRVTPVPSYAVVDIFSGKGIVGGVMASPYEMGREAAKSAVLITQGTPVDSIPSHDKTPQVSIFDYEQMQRFDIDDSLLPGGSQIINSPPDSVELTKEALYLVIISIIALILIVLTLIFYTRRLGIAKELLTDSERRYQTVVENQTEFICRFLPDLTMIFVNDAYCRYFGVPLKKVLGSRYHPDIPKEDRLKLEGLLLSLTPEHPVASLEHRIKMPDGTMRWIHWVDRAVFDSENNLTEYLSVGRDVTDLVESDQARSAAEKRAYLLFDSAHDAIYVSDSEHFVDCNERGTELMGYSREEILKSPIFAFSPELQPGGARSEDILKETLEKFKDGLGQRLEWQLIRKDGVCIDTEISLNSLQVGEETLFFYIIRDITERKQAEQNIQSALDEKTLLLQEVHHRVKNNLAIIISLLGMQIMEESDEKVQSVLTDVETRIMSMAAVHEGLYHSENLSEIDLTEHFRTIGGQIIESYSSSVQTGIQYNVQGTPCYVDLELGVSLSLVVNELITNTIKYAFPGRESGNLQILTDCEGDTIRITVADDGIGIPEDLELASLKSIGLALVNSVVTRQLHGTLSVSGDCGTRWVILIPKPEKKDI